MSKYLNKIKCICDHGWLWSETNQIFVRCEQCKCVNYKCDRTSCPKCGDIIERDTQTRPTFSVGINPARAITIYCHPSIKDKIMEPRAYLIDHNRTQHEINSGW